MSGKAFDLGIRAGTLLSMAGGAAKPEREIFLGIKDGRIMERARFKPSHRAASRKFLDGEGQACLPGLVNGHTHLPMVLLRGVAEDLTFHAWLFERILPLEGKLVSKAFVRDGTELAALECIRFGTTTVNEMYFYAEESAAALDRSGLRAILSQAMASFPLPEDAVVGKNKFAIVEQLRARYKNHPRLTIGLGPHAPYSCDDALLRGVAAFAARTGAPVHIHVSETAKEVKESFEQFGKSPVVRLMELGLLRPGTICAHCVHLDAADRKVFEASGASAVYNPDSNAKLGAGIAPAADYLARAIPLSLGTDGAASNNDLSLFGAMDIGTKLQKLAAGDSAAFRAEQALVAATWGGARALGLPEVGSLELGKRADCILIDLEHPHLQPVHDLVSQVVFACQGLEVSATVCEGRVLFQKGRFATLDQATIFKRAALWRKRIAKLLEA